MSINRVIAAAESLVCSVDKTRCPVSAAAIAVSAVSLSRISPTMMTSGSCRRMLRSAPANVIPFSLLTCTWLINSNWYSTGSSTVTTFRSTPLINSIAEYSVVVLPLPVGPVTSTNPCGRASIDRTPASGSGAIPSLSRSNVMFRRSSTRMTIFSPSTVGSVLIRRSTSRPWTRTWTRPSCGLRCSAMSNLLITLIRDTTAGCISRRGFITSRSTPSTRNRIDVRF